MEGVSAGLSTEVENIAQCVDYEARGVLQLWARNRLHHQPGVDQKKGDEMWEWEKAVAPNPHPTGVHHEPPAVPGAEVRHPDVYAGDSAQREGARILVPIRVHPHLQLLL